MAAGSSAGCSAGAGAGARREPRPRRPEREPQPRGPEPEPRGPEPEPRGPGREPELPRPGAGASSSTGAASAVAAGASGSGAGSVSGACSSAGASGAGVSAAGGAGVSVSGAGVVSAGGAGVSSTGGAGVSTTGGSTTSGSSTGAVVGRRRRSGVAVVVPVLHPVRDAVAVGVAVRRVAAVGLLGGVRHAVAVGVVLAVDDAVAVRVPVRELRLDAELGRVRDAVAVRGRTVARVGRVGVEDLALVVVRDLVAVVVARIDRRERRGGPGARAGARPSGARRRAVFGVARRRSSDVPGPLIATIGKPPPAPAPGMLTKIGAAPFGPDCSPPPLPGPFSRVPAGGCCALGFARRTGVVAASFSSPEGQSFQPTSGAASAPRPSVPATRPVAMVPAKRRSPSAEGRGAGPFRA